jgi:hypothetical protein
MKVHAHWINLMKIQIIQSLEILKERAARQMSQPHFGQVWGSSPTLGKVGDLESSGTPECLELNSKAQNTSHCGVLGVIGKVLKRRYRKCPRIDNSDN